MQSVRLSTSPLQAVLISKQFVPFYQKTPTILWQPAQVLWLEDDPAQSFCGLQMN